MKSNAIISTTRRYDRWLTTQTSVVKADVAVKHERMAQSAFLFLRATYYWWVSRWPHTLPELAAAPPVHGIGDLHMENFGTWRDAEGRLVWGINDFDEAHTVPYTNDLVRLATSVVLAARSRQLRVSAQEACDSILEGYALSLARGGWPIVLAERRRWLRSIAIAQLKDPDAFWRKMLAGTSCAVGGYPAKAIRDALPDRRLEHVVHRRRAGIGSLGRPRFVAIALHGGGHIARELKAVVPSAQAWANGTTASRAGVPWLLANAVRVPDPFYRVTPKWVTRRLAPDCGKLDISELTEPRDQSRLLRAMGKEAANIHLAGPTRTVIADLERRPKGWLHDAAAQMANVMTADWKAWQRR